MYVQQDYGSALDSLNLALRLNPDRSRMGEMGRLAERSTVYPSIGRRDVVYSSHPDLLERTSRRGRAYGSQLDLNVKNLRGSPVLAIHTRASRVVEPTRLETEKGERMVTIRCERLSSEREVEQVEIEIPLPVYNKMQAQSKGPNRSSRSATRRRGLVHKLWKIFAKA